MPKTCCAALAVVCIVLAAGGLGCKTKATPAQTATGPTPTGPTTPGTPATDIAAALQTLAARAIYFGHQSVGSNIMDGVQALINATAGTVPRVQNTSSAAAMQKGVFAHAGNGTNGDPIGKTTAFRATIQGGVGARVDIAFVKFCYVDFGGSTDVAAVFADYRSTMAALKSAYPGVRFVHVTVPLETGANAGNVVRERFSELVRGTFGGSEPVFDLAKVESTRPDGSTESFNGVRALVAAYSSDGGHLNATGAEVVSKALVLYLASL
jgi:hypothetical protein